MNAYHLTKIKQHFPINSITDIKAEVSRELVKLRPFIKPDAQIAIAIGTPVRSSMEVVELAQGDSPVPVYMDKHAYHSDGVILIKRIKPHTDFHARYESGPVKMSVIGLGKEKQASAIHRYGVFGLTAFIPSTAKQVFNTGKILGGIAMLENAYDDTMFVKALNTDDIFEQEPILLEIARKNMHALPVSDIEC